MGLEVVELPFEKTNYIQTKENKDDWFVDYSYEYDIKTKHLTVYYFGKRLFSIKPNELEYYERLFEIDSSIANRVCFNPNTLTYDLTYLKEMKRFIKENPTIEQLNQFIQTPLPICHFSQGQIVDVWNHQDRPSYQKKLYFQDGTKPLTFIVTKEWDGKYQINLQLPFIRITLFNDLSSERKAKQTLIDYVKSQQLELGSTAKLFEMFNERKQQLENLLTETHQSASISDIDQWAKESKECLQDFFTNHTTINQRDINCDSFKRQLSDLSYHALVKCGHLSA